MSNQEQHSASTPNSGDGKADAFAAVAIIALVVSAVVFWLKGMSS
jgi:hypothetical protein